MSGSRDTTASPTLVLCSIIIGLQITDWTKEILLVFSLFFLNILFKCTDSTLLETNAADTGNMTLREESIDNVWEDFVVQFLLGSSHIQQAAIFDLATQRPLATQGGLTISEQEMKQLVVCLQHRELAYR